MSPENKTMEPTAKHSVDVRNDESRRLLLSAKHHSDQVHCQFGMRGFFYDISDEMVRSDLQRRRSEPCQRKT
jgi:hypothetical protein